ncbi:MAG: peptide deformylase [Ruminococcus sp.]|nr:peptide deformylase [Ruminococcus sp.]
MVKEIVRDVEFLSQKSAPASNKDREIINDLCDTLKANRRSCVGMAANMIGSLKRIIIFHDGASDHIMVNPKIIKKTGPYETEEGCLSLEGTRPVTRFSEITVEYLDESFVKRRRSFTGFTAQTIQHECDHLEGRII